MSATAQFKQISGYDGIWRKNLFVCLFGSFATFMGMTIVFPFLPIFIGQLGIQSRDAIIQWSAIAYGATFVAATIAAPIWGRFADRFGHKATLLRASFGMALAISLMGLTQNVYELVFMRLLLGFVGGYASGSIVLVATQAPRSESAWALGLLSTGGLAGALTGPFIGGLLPALIGLRYTFLAGGLIVMLAFLATLVFVRDVPKAVDPSRDSQPRSPSMPMRLENKIAIVAMVATALILIVSCMSIEPIITVYVGKFTTNTERISLISGISMSAMALGSLLAAPFAGRIADRVGAWNVIVGSLMGTGLLLIPQATVDAEWKFVLLRFLMGISVAGILPSVAAIIRDKASDGQTGVMLGWSNSAQYVGQVLGPLFGSLIATLSDIETVFIISGIVLICGAGLNGLLARQFGRRAGHK